MSTDTTKTTTQEPVQQAKSVNPSDAAAAAASAAKGFKIQSDAFAELDSMFGEETAKQKQPQEKAEKKPVEKPQEKPQEKSVVKKEQQEQPQIWPEKEETKTEDQSEQNEEQATKNELVKKEETGKKKQSPVESLRDAYEKSKAKNSELEKEIERIKNSPNDDPEKKALAERLEASEKRKQELEEELRYSAYEKSEEYKEKYENPMASAFKSAYEEISGLDIADAEGNTRKATNDDFNLILRMPLNQAIATAKELFGDASAEVLAHRRDILKMNQDRIHAVDEYRKKGSEIEKQRIATTAQQRDRISKLWETNNKEILEKYPEWFKPVDGDDAGNRLLENGYRVADMAFSPPKGMSQDETVKIHAAVRNKAAGFDRMANRVKQLKSRVTELESELTKYSESEPKKGEGKRSKEEHKTWEAELDALVSNEL